MPRPYFQTDKMSTREYKAPFLIASLHNLKTTTEQNRQQAQHTHKEEKDTIYEETGRKRQHVPLLLGCATLAKCKCVHTTESCSSVIITKYYSTTYECSALLLLFATLEKLIFPLTLYLLTYKFTRAHRTITILCIQPI